MRCENERGRSWTIGVVLLGCLAVIAASFAPVRAQGSMRDTNARGVGGPADDGDPFARYTTPGQCKQAAMRLRQHYWHDKRRDLLRYQPEQDSVPAPVVQAIRQCAARFSVATVADRDLLDLAQLYLWAQQDSLARLTVDRLQRTLTSRPAAARGWVWYLLARDALRTYPARVTLARTYLGRLDAIGVPAATWRLFAHTQFSEYAMSLDDRAMAEADARAALVASHQMTVSDRIDWVYSLANAYEVLTVPTVYTRGGAAALSLVDTAVADLVSLRVAGTREQSELRENILGQRAWLASFGKPGLPIHAAAWYGTNGDTVRPRKGVATLAVFLATTCRGGCYPAFATLRRLHEKYGASLDIVIMVSTAGWFHDQPMPTPSVEADSAGSYYTRYQQLPVALAVETTSFHYIPDGRRRDESTANQRAYNFGRQAALLDRTGNVRWLGTPEPEQEATLDAIIQSVLKTGT